MASRVDRRVTCVLALLLSLTRVPVDGFLLTPGPAGARGLRMELRPGPAPPAVPRREALWMGAAAALLWRPCRAAADNAHRAEALFSAGDPRFLQAIFETKRGSGIIATEVGKVSDGTRALKVVYDPAMLSFKALLGTYWRNVNPTDGGGQFKDRGGEFRPVIFAASAEQRAMAEKSQKLLVASGNLLKSPLFIVNYTRALTF